MEKIKEFRVSPNKANVKKLAEYLKSTVGMTSSQFKGFKKCIQDAQHWGLSLDRLQEDQPKHLWDLLIAKIHDKYQVLDKFHDFWPVQVYWDTYSCKSLAYHNHRSTTSRCIKNRHASFSPTSARLARETIPVRSVSLDAARKVKYVGRPLPEYRNIGREPSSSRRVFQDIHNILPAQSPSVQVIEPIISSASPSSPIDLRTPSPRIQRSVLLSTPPAFGLYHSLPASLVSATGTPSNEYTTASLSPSGVSIWPSNSPACMPPFSNMATACGSNTPEPITATQRIWPEACLSCGALPKLERADTSELPVFLNLDRNDDLLNILAANGIFTNHHLHLVMQMTPEQRTGFFDSTSISAFRALGLREDMEKYGERLGFRRKEYKVPFPLPGQIVPQPTEEVLDELSKPATKHEKLGESMKISMDLYWDITNVLLTEFKSIVEPFPQTMFLDEIKNQHTHKWDEFQRVVCNERPVLLNYEDRWPIEVYIRRHLAQIPTPQQKRSSWSPSVFQTKIAKVFYCPLHMVPALDSYPISIMLRVHFKTLGIEELIPAAVLLGIRSDEDFLKMIQMDDVQVGAIVEQDKSVKLTPLHKFLLKLAFRKLEPRD
ncbi:uncharacterized protein BT62DRAFT_744353 [Guyanagaster necrorhizus]|uniref:Uncharacterized protein n=1 Tax=Guyanagaster necrorhizus TaxID=856835 RepID=A0A9P8AUE1_9AGAR|nr:uncharacterized protein BT62DRAFT_744353 [Guyanagaster necrorhizus MCA 3950]KAG7447951.1 hypothetical protein BT62DRAFT_744353 [Guyanagaster necrorhizus MCA 3950]